MIKFFGIFCSIFLLSFVGCYGVAFAQSATLYFSPSSGNFFKGKTFWVDIFTNTKGEVANAVGAYFTYPEDMLEFADVTIINPFITFEKTGVAGKVKISVGLPSPGFSGIKKIASVGFAPKVSSGNATLSFTSDAVVLRDSDNQNILNLVGSGKGVYAFNSLAQPSVPSVPQSTPIPTPQGFFISNVEAKQAGPQQIVVSFNTSRIARSQIDYGLSNAYNLSYVNIEEGKSHIVFLSGLQSSSIYHFQITSKDAQGNIIRTKDSTFAVALEYEQDTLQQNIVVGTLNSLFSVFPVSLETMRLANIPFPIFLTGVAGVLLLFFIVVIILRKRRKMKSFSQ